MSSRTLSVVIAGDATGARRAFGDVTGEVDSLQTRLQNAGKSMMRTGALMTAGITAPLAVLGKVAFDAASDLNESLNKVDVVFGDSAKSIRRWAEDASSSLLMSKQEALEAAGTLGSVFKASGLGVPEAAKMSKAMVQLAADMGSFNNVPTDEMLIAIRAGLVGEIEPLRKFGVLLNAATVEAKAIEMGLADANGEISEGAKVQARYALILEQTVDQQGDVGRTAGSAANRQKELRAKFMDTAAALGTSLIPIMQTLMEVVKRVADWFGNLDPKMQKIIVIVGLAVAALGPLVASLGALITVIGAVSLPVLAVVAAIGLVVGAVVAMWLKWDEIWNLIKEHPAIAAVVAIMAWPVTATFVLIGAIKALYENWDSVWGGIRSVISAVWGKVEPIFNAWWGAVTRIAEAIEWLAAVAADAFGRFARAVHDMWNTVDGPLMWLLERLREVVSIAKRVRDAVGSLPGFGGGIVPDSIPFVGGFATGGVVPGPVGQPAWAIVHGGERILNSEQQSLGGDLTVVIQLDGEVVARSTVKHVNRMARGGPVLVGGAVA